MVQLFSMVELSVYIASSEVVFSIVTSGIQLLSAIQQKKLSLVNTGIITLYFILEFLI